MRIDSADLSLRSQVMWQSADRSWGAWGSWKGVAEGFVDTRTPSGRAGAHEHMHAETSRAWRRQIGSHNVHTDIKRHTSIHSKETIGGGRPTPTLSAQAQYPKGRRNRNPTRVIPGNVSGVACCHPAPRMLPRMIPLHNRLSVPALCSCAFAHSYIRHCNTVKQHPTLSEPRGLSSRIRTPHATPAHRQANKFAKQS